MQCRLNHCCFKCKSNHKDLLCQLTPIMSMPSRSCPFLRQVSDTHKFCAPSLSPRFPPSLLARTRALNGVQCIHSRSRRRAGKREYVPGRHRHRRRRYSPDSLTPETSALPPLPPSLSRALSPSLLLLAALHSLWPSPPPPISKEGRSSLPTAAPAPSPIPVGSFSRNNFLSAHQVGCIAQ